ncbi:MAG TPA: Cof-type HAD-IIB family hydrolase [Candidatus Limnocylindrales bacterium]|nr:Cof-type HAD-IIB family hydrolase [Candidatus Limnocylindrales bacterium]
MRGAFPIRLLALDIDGTLVGPDLVLGERTMEAVRAARALGVRISLVTGRMASSAMRFVAQLGLDDPVVAYQGALIRAMPPPDRLERWRAAGDAALPPPVGRALLHTPLPGAVARETVHWSRARGLDPHANHLERFIVRADDPRIEDYSAFMGARAELVPDLADALSHPVTKVLAVGDAALPIAFLDDARRDFAGRADATISHPRFLEFVAPGVSKGRALRWLARRTGVPMEQTMAIGDQWNDLEMLALAGHGVAMAGAPIEVRAAATYVAPPVELEGAATMIEALVLAGRGAEMHAHRLAAEARRALDEPVRTSARRATA